MRRQLFSLAGELDATRRPAWSAWARRAPPTSGKFQSTWEQAAPIRTQSRRLGSEASRPVSSRAPREIRRAFYSAAGTFEKQSVNAPHELSSRQLRARRNSAHASALAGTSAAHSATHFRNSSPPIALGGGVAGSGFRPLADSSARHSAERSQIRAQ